MSIFSGSFSIFISSLLQTLFRFFSSIFLRFDREDSSLVNNEPCLAAMPETFEFSASKNDDDCEYYDVEDEEEIMEPSFVFKFEYQTNPILEAMENVDADHGCSSGFEKEVKFSSKNYQFKAEKHVSFYEEESKVATFVVREASSDESSSDSMVIENEGVKDLATEECVQKEEAKEASFDVKEESHEDKEQEFKCEEQDEKNVFLKDMESVVVESASDSDDTSSLCSSPELSFMGQFSADGLLSEADYSERVELEDNDLQHLDVGYVSDGFDEEDEDVMEQLQELEKGLVPTRSDEQHEKPNEGLENSDSDDSEELNTLETLWEHQELIEQLKMELKKVKGSGLPTILEESESPNMDDLKPWKIDEKFHHGDRMSVLHKFYKAYRERMRKFDILSYQKLYALGFLQSKDTLERFSSCKSSTPAIKSFLMQNFGLFKPKKNSDSDPVVKFIRELHSELEVVYVGQLCLSWEFLQWQYEKALEIWECDEYGLRSYNGVAGEFQQFQVLMQRFMENERFQVPRVENYVKNRCVMRNLIHIPVIREDNMKKTKKAKRKGRDFDYTIGSDLLVEILQESIRTMWRFICADKSVSTMNVCRKRLKSAHEESFDPKLLVEVQADLQKKEKKLKEVLRSENCILKRFKSRREKEEEEAEGSEHMYLFCQVDMRLVSRVLNMLSLTSEQLVWCHNKLSRIHFVDRKIRVEPSFLLFPC